MGRWKAVVAAFAAIPMMLAMVPAATAATTTTASAPGDVRESSIVATSDTFVASWKKQKLDNYNTANDLVVQNTADGQSQGELGEQFVSTNTNDATDLKMTFLAFDLSSLGGQKPLSADLTLTLIGRKTGVTSPTGTLRVAAIDPSTACTTDAQCDFSKITWANRPQFTADTNDVITSESFIIDGTDVSSVTADVTISGTQATADVAGLVDAAIARGDSTLLLAVNDTTAEQLHFVSTEGSRNLTNANTGMAPALHVTRSAKSVGVYGQSAMSVLAGYAATTSPAFDVTGDGATVAVTDAGDGTAGGDGTAAGAVAAGKVTWDATAKRLNIAAGLAAGTYPMRLTATDATGAHAGLTFTLTVQKAAPSAKQAGMDNPLMDYQYGADPWAMEYDGRLYVYMSSDAMQVTSDGQVVQTYETNGDGSLKNNTYRQIKTISVISTDDMANWRNEGQIRVSGTGGANPNGRWSWAPAVVHKTIDGVEKFFMYYTDNNEVHVLTSDSPVGPWTDPLGGRALVKKSTAGVKLDGATTPEWVFDPAALVDDDGTGYLYLGGGQGNEGGTGANAAHPKYTRVFKLGDDMISLTGDVKAIDAPGMYEDSGIVKIGDTYYYSYCSNLSYDVTADGLTLPKGDIHVMTSKDPMGPYTYQGDVMRNPGDFFGIFGNNHHAMFTFKGKTYMVYHAQTIMKSLIDAGVAPSGGTTDDGVEKGYTYRSTHIDEMTVNADGMIEPVTMTMTGVPQTQRLDPYTSGGVAATTIARSSGLQTLDRNSGVRVSDYGVSNADGVRLTNVNAGEWTSLSGVDFGADDATGAASVAVRAIGKAGGTIAIHLDSVNGPLAGTVTIPAGDGASATDFSGYATYDADLTGATGVHDVYFVFNGDSADELFDVASYTFIAAKHDGGDGDNGGPGDNGSGGNGSGGNGDGEQGDGGNGDGNQGGDGGTGGDANGGTNGTGTGSDANGTVTAPGKQPSTDTAQQPGAGTAGSVLSATGAGIVGATAFTAIVLAAGISLTVWRKRRV